MERHQIKPREVTNVIQLTHEKLNKRFMQKGMGILVSSHECLGVIKEEYDEYSMAVHDNNKDRQYKELEDMAVACLLAMISMSTGKMDW
jgi:hypothetical protein